MKPEPLSDLANWLLEERCRHFDAIFCRLCDEIAARGIDEEHAAVLMADAEKFLRDDLARCAAECEALLGVALH